MIEIFFKSYSGAFVAEYQNQEFKATARKSLINDIINYLFLSGQRGKVKFTQLGNSTDSTVQEIN